MKITATWFKKQLKQPNLQHTLSLQQGNINYTTWGNPHNPAILFIHGGVANNHWWDHIAPSFMDKYCIYCLDLPGCGQSSWRTKYKISAITQSFHEILATNLSTRLPTIIGHSFGGNMAFCALVDNPQAFNNCIIIDSFPILQAKQYTQSVKMRRLKYYSNQAEILKRFRVLPEQPVPHLFITNHIAMHSIYYEKQNGWRWQFDPNFYQKLQYEEKYFNAFQSPPQKYSNMTYLYADKSAIIDKTAVAVYKSKFPELEVHKINNSHHAIMLDQPLQLIDCIQDILGPVAS